MYLCDKKAACFVVENVSNKMECNIGDTFFVRSDSCDPDYGYFWDIWANVKILKGLRKGVYGAHVGLNCQQNCARLLPNCDELCRLQEQITTIVQNECFEETLEGLNDLALQCLLVYNELYYRLMEAAARHQ